MKQEEIQNGKLAWKQWAKDADRVCRPPKALQYNRDRDGLEPRVSLGGYSGPGHPGEIGLDNPSDMGSNPIRDVRHKWLAGTVLRILRQTGQWLRRITCDSFNDVGDPLSVS